MEKWMIASDLHGSASHTRRLLQAFRQEQPRKLLLLGDLLYQGMRAGLEPEERRETADLLNSVKDDLLCVRGNCDQPEDLALLDFPVEEDYRLLVFGGYLVFATHGHRYWPGFPPPLSRVEILLTGHTHIPACQQTGPLLYLNPGSAARPHAGSYPSYMTVEDRHIQWKELSGRVYREHWLPEKTADKR